MGGGYRKPRADRRRAVDWQVACRCVDWHAAARIANLSRRGLFVRTEAAPGVGAAVELTIELPDGLRLDLRGVVRHVVTPERAQADGLLAGAGIELEAQAGGDLNLLEQIIEAELITPASSEGNVPAMASAPPPAVDEDPGVEYSLHRRKR